MGALYRFGQLWRLITAEPLPNTLLDEVAASLSRPEMALFQRLSDNDQWHSYRVYRALKEAGHTHPDLLAAALLHDVGKTRVALSVWDRSTVVLAQVALP